MATKPLFHIHPITDPTHPAYPQHGLIATVHLAPETFITFYLGEVHADSREDESYTLSLTREPSPISITALTMGNEARFINDYRNIPGVVSPNAEFRDVWVEIPASQSPVAEYRRRSDKVWEKRIGVFVKAAGKAGKKATGIRKGEEILVSYGKGYWA